MDRSITEGGGIEAKQSDAILRDGISPQPNTPLNLGVNVIHAVESDGMVVVRDQSMMYALWRSGSYGVGTLSRTKPTWSARIASQLCRAQSNQVPGSEKNQEKFVENLTTLRKLNRLDNELRSQRSNALDNQLIQLSAINELDSAVEVLHLLPEEVIFLASKNMLEVYGETSVHGLESGPIGLNTLTRNLLWNSDLIARAIAYRFFREQGWIPKSGIKFGVDLMLYHKRPEISHSKYAVILNALSSESFSQNQLPLPKFKGGSVAWLKTVERVASHAKKLLILCYVPVPNELADLNDSVLKRKEKGGCHCIQLKRWIPERHR